MVRTIKCIKEKEYTTRKFEFFKKSDDHDELSKLKQVLKFKVIKITKYKSTELRHIEIVIGYKYYVWQGYYAVQNRWPWMTRETASPASFNFVYCKDSDWA